ncbi:MAG TPA: hypothetical protein VIU34_00950 [Steroidobacter sp.]
MKPTNPRCCALLVTLAVLASPALADLAPPSYPLELSKKDRRMLEELACTDPHGVPAEKMEITTIEPGKLSWARADIVCKAHATFRQKPMSYSVYCAVLDGRWDCSKSDLRIVVPVDNREIIVSPGKYEPGFAYDTISKVARAGSFKNYSLAEIIRSSCALSPGLASEWVDIYCSGVRVTVSSWCPQAECPRIVSIVELMI